MIQVRGLVDGQVYALKELSVSEPINLQLWTQECQILQSLSHRNLVGFVDAFIDVDSYFIATEFCSGGTLLNKVIRMKSISEITASRYLADILSAIDHMHSRKIVHRDLKVFLSLTPTLSDVSTLSNRFWTHSALKSLC